MIKLIVLIAIIVVGLMYFDVIDLGNSNDVVQDTIDGSAQTFEEFKN